MVAYLWEQPSVNAFKEQSMKQLHAWAFAAAISLATAAVTAQTETKPESTPTPEQSSPAPSTSPTEGTAADTTPPGETPTQGGTTTQDPSSPTASPAPSTSQTEGTAADSTPPGETATSGEAATSDDSTADDGMPGSARVAAAGDTAQSKHRMSKLVGMSVQSSSGEALGTVKDVILDNDGRVTHVIVERSSGGGASQLVAMPWDVANKMMKGGNLVVEQKRLAQAPGFSEQRWPDTSGSTWSSETDRYWSAQGSMR
jgi:sporulation protein YlmC with PRC-barrel domain